MKMEITLDESWSAASLQTREGRESLERWGLAGLRVARFRLGETDTRSVDTAAKVVRVTRVPNFIL